MSYFVNIHGVQRMIYNDKKYLGLKIREYRNKKGYTQAKLAEMVGLSDKHIGRLEAGAFYPSCTAFLKIISVLDIGLDEFGVNIKSEQSEVRENILKLIYQSTESELNFIYPLLKSVIDNLKYLRKKY